MMLGLCALALVVYTAAIAFPVARTFDYRHVYVLHCLRRHTLARDVLENTKIEGLSYLILNLNQLPTYVCSQ